MPYMIRNVLQTVDISVHYPNINFLFRKIGMICSVKPVLTEDLCVVQNEEFSVCANCTLDERPNILERQTHLLVRGDIT
jgi:hypothetical protein